MPKWAFYIALYLLWNCVCFHQPNMRSHPAARQGSTGFHQRLKRPEPHTRDNGFFMCRIPSAVRVTHRSLGARSRVSATWFNAVIYVASDDPTHSYVVDFIGLLEEDKRVFKTDLHLRNWPLIFTRDVIDDWFLARGLLIPLPRGSPEGKPCLLSRLRETPGR